MADELPRGLHIVATPIGNLGDLSPRAAGVLAKADLLLVEDTRVTARLLNQIGTKTPMRRYDDHATAEQRAAIVAELGSKAIALVSDAGTPLVSDPGFKLVQAARHAGHAVHTVPGPCAAIAALTLAGLPTDRFLFAGFLPAKEKPRTEAIAELAAIRATLLFYESGPRLAAALGALAAGLGERDAAVARELTKLHEECVTGTLGQLADRYRESAPKGEIVIAVGPPAESEPASDEELDSALRQSLTQLSPSRAAAEVAAQLGLPRRRVYARALELSRQ